MPNPASPTLVMASFNPALWHGLRHHGAVAPGYQADLLVLPDLVSFLPEAVLKRGRPLEDVPRVEIPDWVRQSVRIRALDPAGFAIPWSAGNVRAIGLIEDQVVTEALVREPVVEGGHAVASADRDLAKIAVVERHLATGRVGLGFVSGSGLQRGTHSPNVGEPPRSSQTNATPTQAPVGVATLQSGPANDRH